MADAGHMLTDVVALGLSLFAFWLSGRPKTNRRTFGWHRFEIFAGFVNGLALWAIAVLGLVANVLDLHVWTITSGFVSLSAHLTVRKGTDPRAFLRDANEVLTSRFGIRHSTLQTEEADEPSCPTGTCEDPG